MKKLHYRECNVVMDSRFPCICDDLERDGRMSRGEIAAWVIFMLVIFLFIFRILINIYTI